jgi:hypothetical protein
MDHAFNAKDVCTTCGCTRVAVAHYGWTCQPRPGHAPVVTDDVYRIVSEKADDLPISKEEADAEIKVLMEKLPEPDFWMLKCLTREKARGFVVWDHNVPTGFTYQTHKFSFLDAVQRGLQFLRTDCWDEWLVCGPAALALVRTLPSFIEQPKRPDVGAKLNYVGVLNRIEVYAYPTIGDENEFWVGRAEQAVVGQIDANR